MLFLALGTLSLVVDGTVAAVEAEGVEVYLDDAIRIARQVVGNLLVVYGAMSSNGEVTLHLVGCQAYQFVALITSRHLL